MKKITYLELLEMAKEGNPPEVIEEDGIRYRLCRGFLTAYKDEYGEVFTPKDLRWMVNQRHITIIEPILTEEEREYLKAVIRPWRDAVYGIRIVSHRSDWEYLKIGIKADGNICFPSFPKGKYYKGMERDKDYTLEELDL